MRFEDLDLSDEILDALWDMRFEECTPIQEATIPHILEGKDILGCAQTGTGKTAAYLLPTISKLCTEKYDNDKVHCIIMSPTRELAQQIDQAFQGFAYYAQGITGIPVYGGNDGVRYGQEMNGLKSGADIIIATPGRLLSHIQMGSVDFSDVRFFILDEADRMLDMGFHDDIMRIASNLPERHQTIMFSATMPPKIQKLAEDLMKNPEIIKLSVSKPAERIRQSCVYVSDDSQKIELIERIFDYAKDMTKVIIFAGKKDGVKKVNKILRKHKIRSGEMHSDLSQKERDDIMFKFKAKQLDVLVATDIIARGIDIDNIQMVINYDVPNDAEDYVHRVGRTARAERDGIAVTLVDKKDLRSFKEIEQFLEYDIEINKELSSFINAPLEAPKYDETKEKRERSRGNGHYRRHGAGGNRHGKNGNRDNKEIRNSEKNDNRRSRKGKKTHPIKQPDRPQK